MQTKRAIFVALVSLAMIAISPVSARLAPALPGLVKAGAAKDGASSLSGRWEWQEIGVSVDITATNGQYTAKVKGSEWPMTSAGNTLTATKALSGLDARALFPDLGDMVRRLPGKRATLAFVPSDDGETIAVAFTVFTATASGQNRLLTPVIAGILRRESAQNAAARLAASGNHDQASSVTPSAPGAPALTVLPAPAPNAAGSPPGSFAPWAANAITALENGSATLGSPTQSPAAYFQSSAGTDRSNIVSNFDSWDGFANPGTMFGAAFANESGNRAHFGLHIVGNGTQFRLSNLSFVMTSTDAGNNFGFAGAFTPADVYSATRVGLIKPNTFITSGPATQLVDEFFYVGIGNAEGNTDVPCPPDPPALDQPTLDCVKAFYDSIIPFNISVTYTLTDDLAMVIGTGTGTVNFSAFNSCLSNGQSFFQFNTMTGAYSFTRCSDGFTISGTGMVRIVNNIAILTDNKPDRRISAGFNLGTQTGSANITLIIAPGVFQTFRVLTSSHACMCGG